MTTNNVLIRYNQGQHDGSVLFLFQGGLSVKPYHIIKSGLSGLTLLFATLIMFGFLVSGDAVAQGDAGQSPLLVVDSASTPGPLAAQAITNPPLYSQQPPNATGFAAAAQTFPNGVAFDYIWAADDFVIPTSVVEWTINQVRIEGGMVNASVPVNVPEVTVLIFPDAGGVPSGAPNNTASAVYNSGALGPASFTQTPTDEFEVDLPSPPTLTPGSYWLVFYITMNFNDGSVGAPFGQFGWQLTAAAQQGSTAQFYASAPVAGCSADTWCSISLLSFPPASTPSLDLSFDLYGTLVPLGGAVLVANPNVLNISEDAAAPTVFTLSLTNPPNPGETITLDFSFDGSQIAVTPGTTTFTDTNFSTTVTVSAIADGITEPPTPANIQITTTSSLGTVSPLNALLELVVVNVFDTADQIVVNVPNLGMVELEVPQDIVPALQEPGGGVIRRDDLSPIFLPNDFDGNGFDMMQITDFQIDPDGTIWFALWIGSANFGWIEYLPATMRIEGDIIHLIN